MVTHVGLLGICIDLFDIRCRKHSRDIHMLTVCFLVGLLMNFQELHCNIEILNKFIYSGTWKHDNNLHGWTWRVLWSILLPSRRLQWIWRCTWYAGWSCHCWFDVEPLSFLVKLLNLYMLDATFEDVIWQCQRLIKMILHCNLYFVIFSHVVCGTFMLRVNVRCCHFHCWSCVCWAALYCCALCPWSEKE